MSRVMPVKIEPEIIVSADVLSVIHSVEWDVDYVLKDLTLVIDCEVNATFSDVNLMALYDLLDSLELQFYRSGRLFCRYAYRFSNRQLPPSMCAFPLRDRPSIGLGARARVIVAPKEGIETSVWDRWIARLGWVPAPPLQVPTHPPLEECGFVVSGGYNVTRSVVRYPDFIGEANWADANTFCKLR